MSESLALAQSRGTFEEQEVVLKEMKARLEEVTHNYQTLQGEWHTLQEVLKADQDSTKKKILNKRTSRSPRWVSDSQDMIRITAMSQLSDPIEALGFNRTSLQVCGSLQVPKDYVLVHKNDLSQLATETSQLKVNLPKVINSGLSAATTRVDSLQEEVERLRQRDAVAEAEMGQWRTRFEASVAECQKEKEGNLQLRCEVQELTDQLSQQSDFSSSLGASCCTLLWRVSRSQDTVQTLLSGTKIDDFLSLVTSTVESYVSAYKDDWPQEQSDESGFILALVGIITTYGRDFLISRDSGRHLVDTFTNFLADAPLKKSARLKNLLLMSLYNLSINQRALKYICSKPGIIGLLAWHLQEETDCENRLNTLRVVHSLVADEHNTTIMHELAEALPEHFLQQLTTDKNQDVQDLALDLIMDLRQGKHEQ